MSDVVRMARRARGIAVLLGALLVPMALSGCNQLLACDDSTLQSTMKQKIEEATHLKITNVSDIKTVSRTDQAATCTMNVTADDGSKAVMTYQLTKSKDGTDFKVTNVQ